MLSLIVGICAAYILARRRFRFGLKRPNDLLGAAGPRAASGGLHHPPVHHVQQDRLLNTKIPVTLACVLINVPLIIWFLISFFQDLPEEVEESAKVDGRHRVAALPQDRPAPGGAGYRRGSHAVLHVRLE